jgi:hypothetical protein
MPCPWSVGQRVTLWTALQCIGLAGLGAQFESYRRSGVPPMIRDMPTLGSEFTTLERAVLTAICKMYSVDRGALEAQLSTATLLSRENTGGGFFTRFSVDRASSAGIEGMRLRDGPTAKIDGLEHGMGFILWLKEGYADCLEGYAYAESTTGIVLEAVDFEIFEGTTSL